MLNSHHVSEKSFGGSWIHSSNTYKERSDVTQLGKALSLGTITHRTCFSFCVISGVCFYMEGALRRAMSKEGLTQFFPYAYNLQSSVKCLYSAPLPPIKDIK